MIPIRDTIPSRNYPVVNNTIIGINVVVFLVQLSQGDDLIRFNYIYGLVPARYTISHFSSYFSAWDQLFSLISFMFLHGGFFHLLGNMWSLYIFGDNIEDSLGPLRYLVFYLLCGLASGLSHLLLNLHSNIPTIGASGAISGVMGAYFLLYPKSRILTIIPIIIIPWFVELPAFIFLGIWILMQMLNAAGSQAGAAGIAWWAHIGGFLFGIVFLKAFQAYPNVGVMAQVAKATARKKTDKLQIIHPVSQGDSPHMYGVLAISIYESLTGTQKMVNVPWGFQNRLFRVSVPAGTRHGSLLKLQGLGKIISHGERGDLYLKVLIQDQGMPR
ncbi:MAG: rhomboid family intramembrane serine protease [Pseudomonadota bacterium]